MKGAYILIGLSFVFALLPLVSFSIASILQIVSLVFIWCWIALWIKRYHDGGKSGWMCLLPIVVWLILTAIVMGLASTLMPSGAEAEMEAAMNEAVADGGDFGSMMSMMMGASKEVAKETALRSAIAGAIPSLIVAFLFNAMIKKDPSDNQYGPA
jgi:hypothetical protein